MCLRYEPRRIAYYSDTIIDIVTAGSALSPHPTVIPINNINPILALVSTYNASSTSISSNDNTDPFSTQSLRSYVSSNSLSSDIRYKSLYSQSSQTNKTVTSQVLNRRRSPPPLSQATTASLLDRSLVVPPSIAAKASQLQIRSTTQPTSSQYTTNSYYSNYSVWCSNK